MRCLRSLPVVALMIALGSVAVVRGQGSVYKLGRTPTDAEIKAWDIAIGPDGRELPAGKGTAMEGASTYASKCAVCHGQKGEGGLGPALVGGTGTLATDHPVKTVGSYWAFATTVWDVINREMPLDKPGTLAADEVYALTAFILARNGIIADADVLNAETLPKVQMPNRHGFYPETPDDRPDYSFLWPWREARPRKPAK